MSADDVTPRGLDHESAQLYRHCRDTLHSDAANETKRMALSICRELRLVAEAYQLDQVRATLMVNFGPESKRPIIEDANNAAEALYAVLRTLVP